ncbi:hypothetical protein DPMN_042903 [Dreissena polymorpha]|uniref:Globin domain-containing protein n=1 Tax=Dreissena polymorpha TaxID=45954 RepID=A0A9D4D1M7_DREPO|nr:hypothetical protein DPMN_042903 [Dreissena polymorpha]
MGNKLTLGEASFSIRDKQLQDVITCNQLVKKSWNLLNGDLDTLGGIVFRRFFEIEPQLKIVFPKIVHINHDNKLDANIDMDMLIRHGAVVMKALGAAVESLGDSSCLNSVIITIGQIHCYRNVKPKMIKKLWPCLNYGLQSVLKENYTKEVAQAWRCLYYYICGLMIHGMLNPDTD